MVKKTGEFSIIILSAILMAFVYPVFASGEVEFSATADRTHAAMDDAVSLKMSVRTEGATRVGEPHFSAPDFEVVNEYNSTFIESFYENGRFGVRNNRQITKILRPLKQGALRISGIEVNVGGQVYRASDIQVSVGPPGAGTPPPRGYGGSGIGLRGAGKPVSHKNVLLRAEINKEKAYKGEQIIVSYYLYRKVRVFNISVDKYPILTGFLREDLEMPVQGQRLDTERVILDGVAYDRSLLMRYAAYPLQEGKLKIDSVALKYNYYSSSAPNAGSDEDPFMRFFQPQLGLLNGADRSEQLTVEVMPLPEEGRPSSFSGGVGDFSVSAAVDKYDVHANEAFTLTVKVEGRGNVAAISEPKGKWPDDVELYDSKGRAKSGRGGVGEKVFEYLLIPRTPGKLTVPPLEFSFFDPVKKGYVSRSTEPFQINVLEPLPGSTAFVRSKAADNKAVDSSGKGVSTSTKNELRGVKAFDRPLVGLGGQPQWRWIYWLAMGCFGIFVSLVVFDLGKKGRANAKALLRSKAKAHAKSWDRLRENANAAADGASWQEVTRSYELLESAVLEVLDRHFPVGVKSLPRTALKEALVVDRGLSSTLWTRIDHLLEFAETVRFASSIGAVSEKAARLDLKKWVQEAESIAKELASVSRSTF